MESASPEVVEILHFLPISSSLSSETLDQAKSLYSQGKSKNSEWESSKQKIKVQVCVYLSCLLNSQPFEFSQLFTDISQLHSFMIGLKELIKQLPLPQQVHTTAAKLIKNYAISLMNYKKFEELLDKINLSSSYEHTSLIFQAIWLFFLTARKEKYSNTEDLSECGCLIIAVLNLFLSNLPEAISHSISGPCLLYLTSSFRTIPAHVQPFINNVSQLSIDLISREVIKCSIRTSLIQSEISTLVSSLSEQYGAFLKFDELDERFIRSSVCPSNSLLLTPVTRRTVSVHSGTGKVLNWDENIAVNLNTRLNEVLRPITTSFQAETPMTSAMECNTWINKVLEDYSLHGAERICGENFEEIRIRAEELKNGFSLFANRRRSIVTSAKTEDIMKLYYITLESLLKIEKNKGGCLSSIIQNDKFHRALFACCSETILYIININCITFEDILGFHSVSAFDFWKNINSFIQFDVRMPIQVKKHFKDIEEKIITMDGWEENSPVSQAVNRISSETFTGELSHPSFGQFFKRVLSYSANKITDISNCVKLNPPTQEEIWVAFKYFLSEKTEFLISRHLDQAILCTIYGVCKNNKQSVSFKLLFDQHTALYQADNELFTKVKLADGKTGDIIKFYNEVYVNAMKDYLTKKVQVGTPRISTLNPTSPLKANIQPFQVPQSPYMTPRTKRLWAFGENISQTLHGINSMIQITARKINFDLPIKRPRTDDPAQ